MIDLETSQIFSGLVKTFSNLFKVGVGKLALVTDANSLQFRGKLYNALV